MNVHPVSTLDDVLNAISNYVLPIRDRVAPGEFFGLGLWLPHRVARTLRRNLEPLQRVLSDNALYVFSINGFPHGPFHGDTVKRAVYVPDWRDPRRLDYTIDLLHILAQLLPPGVDGSVSTVPVSYGKHLPDNALEQILAAGRAALTVSEQYGCHIRVALEPEPDCYLESTDEVVAFFSHLRHVDSAATRGLGVCFDTCHLCLQGECLSAAYEQLRSAGIAISKVQLSAALMCDNRDERSALDALRVYDEPVYLHQTRVDTGTVVHRFPDLGPALTANVAGEWRVHFHVPLHFANHGVLTSTAESITPSLLRRMTCHTPNIEIETYTFDVLPPPKLSVTESIAREFEWVFNRIDILNNDDESSS